MILGLPSGVFGGVVVATSIIGAIVARHLMVASVNRVVPPNEQFEKWKYLNENTRLWTAHTILFSKNSGPRRILKIAAYVFVIGLLAMLLED